MSYNTLPLQPHNSWIGAISARQSSSSQMVRWKVWFLFSLLEIWRQISGFSFFPHWIQVSGPQAVPFWRKNCRSSQAPWLEWLRVIWKVLYPELRSVCPTGNYQNIETRVSCSTGKCLRHLLACAALRWCQDGWPVQSAAAEMPAAATAFPPSAQPGLFVFTPGLGWQCFPGTRKTHGCAVHSSGCWGVSPVGLDRGSLEEPYGQLPSVQGELVLCWGNVLGWAAAELFSSTWAGYVELTECCPCSSDWVEMITSDRWPLPISQGAGGVMRPQQYGCVPMGLLEVSFEVGYRQCDFCNLHGCKGQRCCKLF